MKFRLFTINNFAYNKNARQIFFIKNSDLNPKEKGLLTPEVKAILEVTNQIDAANISVSLNVIDVNTLHGTENNISVKYERIEKRTLPIEGEIITLNSRILEGDIR